MDKCAFDKGYKCSALTSKMCAGCKFRKTKQELEEGRRKAMERIQESPNRDRIIEKYYSGMRREF